MNKIDKNIIETVCRETIAYGKTTSEIKENAIKFELPVISIMNRIGIDKKQADEILDNFLDQRF